MRILVIEEWSMTANKLIQELHSGTGSSIEHASTFDEGLCKIEQGHGSIDIVMYTVASQFSDAIAFPERVRVLTDEGIFRCPALVLLASSPLPLSCAVKCMDRQIIYLLRGCPMQIIETVRVLLWKIRTSKSGLTIRIEFCGGHYRFFICGAIASEEIVASTQIGRLLLLLLGGTRTAEMLADRLGVSRKTVKKYMRELKLIIDLLMRRMGITELMPNVVWMERRSGGTLCGLRVNPVW
jgi:hypothetical protein